MNDMRRHLQFHAKYPAVIIDGTAYTYADVLAKADAMLPSTKMMIHFKSSADALLTLMASLVMKQPFIVLDDRWPTGYQNQILHR